MKRNKKSDAYKIRFEVKRLASPISVATKYRNALKNKANVRRTVTVQQIKQHEQLAATNIKHVLAAWGEIN